MMKLKHVPLQLSWLILYKAYLVSDRASLAAHPGDAGREERLSLRRSGAAYAVRQPMWAVLSNDALEVRSLVSAKTRGHTAE